MVDVNTLTLIWIIASIFNCISFFIFYNKILEGIKEWEDKIFTDETFNVVIFLIGVIPFLQIIFTISYLELYIYIVRHYVLLCIYFIRHPIIFYRFIRLKL